MFFDRRRSNFALVGVGVMSFGKNLNKIMKNLGMSQSDLAWKSGLTQAAISQILSDKREPSLSTIIAIMQVIPVKFEKLIEETK